MVYFPEVKFVAHNYSLLNTRPANVLRFLITKDSSPKVQTHPGSDYMDPSLFSLTGPLFKLFLKFGCMVEFEEFLLLLAQKLENIFVWNKKEHFTTCLVSDFVETVKEITIFFSVSLSFYSNNNDSSNINSPQFSIARLSKVGKAIISKWI